MLVVVVVVVVVCVCVHLMSTHSVLITASVESGKISVPRSVEEEDFAVIDMHIKSGNK